jgi:hypothetical protein
VGIFLYSYGRARREGGAFFSMLSASFQQLANTGTNYPCWPIRRVDIRVFSLLAAYFLVRGRMLLENQMYSQSSIKQRPIGAQKFKVSSNFTVNTAEPAPRTVSLAGTAGLAPHQYV